MQSTRNLCLVGTVCTTLSLLALASEADILVVDEAGSADFTTIEQAMLAADAGDTIYVLPGSYPAFHFSRGVSVIGLGAAPESTVVDRVDYHVNVPTVGYDTLLANLEVCGAGSGNKISISGNELGPGTLTIDNVSTCGGVFLHGGPEGFYLMVSKSSFEPGPGGGFGGAAFHFGGIANAADIVSSRIVGWNADLVSGSAAGAGLSIEGGSRVRLVNSQVRGGAGLEEPGLDAGADAVASGGVGGPVELRVDGGAEVRGGDGAGEGAGGDGVDVDGSIELGTADVLGGNGHTPGEDFGFSGATSLPLDLYLRVEPEASLAGSAWQFGPGESFRVAMASSVVQASALAISVGVDVPIGTLDTPLWAASPLIIAGKEFEFDVPSLPGLTTPIAFQLYVQGFVVDGPGSGAFHVTNAVTLRFSL